MVSWRQRVRDLERALIHKDEKIYCLEEKIKYLESVIRKFHNENTPTSKLPDWEKKSPCRVNKMKKPVGKPKGSNGATRIVPRIDEEEVVRFSEKEEAYYSRPVDYRIRVVAEIPEVTPVKWTRFYLAQYRDPATRQIITATHPSCPATGIFGPNLRGMIVLLREKANLSEQQTTELLQCLYGFEGVAPATIEAELARVASVLKPDYDTIGKEIDDTEVKHSDETGQSLNGVNWCMYCFSTLKHAYFFCEQKKNSGHIKNRLRDDWKKVLTCDGHSIYEWWHAKQRCWSHAIRKEAWLLDEKRTKERKLLHEAVSGTFRQCKELLKKEPPGTNHLWNVIRLRNRMKQMLNYNWKDEKCRKAANYMTNGFHAWFTFMLVPGVLPTNNLTERDIRKHVMKRRNSGTFRSETGLRNHCIILSTLETWRKSRKNIYKTLTQTLRTHNSTLRTIAA